MEPQSAQQVPNSVLTSYLLDQNDRALDKDLEGLYLGPAHTETGTAYGQLMAK